MITTGHAKVLQNAQINLSSTSTVPPPLSLTPPNLASSSPSKPTSALPPMKKLRISDPALPLELGEYIVHDVKLVRNLGWHKFVRQRRPCSDLNTLDFQHPARHLL